MWLEALSLLAMCRWMPLLLIIFGCFCSVWNRVRLSPGKTIVLFIRKQKELGFLT